MHSAKQKHSAKGQFAACLLGGTRQTVSPRHARQRCCAGRDVCRVSNVRHSANTLLCRVPHCDTRQIFDKIFSSTFQTFVSVPTRQDSLHIKISYIFSNVFYILSIFFIKRLFLEKFKVVLHVFEIMYYNEWKIDIHITESNLSHCRRFERKNRISCT